MARIATFTSVTVRCQRHSTLLEAGQLGCDRCRIIDRNLSLTPPFDVYCIAPSFGVTKSGHIYEVVWVIKDGINKWGTKKEGYCVEHKDDSIAPYILDPIDFIPTKFLTKDFKDSWLENAS